MTKPISDWRLAVYVAIAIVFTLINGIGIANGIYVFGYYKGTTEMLKKCRSGFPPCMVPHVHPKNQYPQQEPPVLKT